VSLCKGREGKAIYTSHILINYRNKTGMLLLIFLCLICKLASVSGDCDVGPWGVKNFDWNKVGIVILTRFLKQAVFKSLLVVYISFV
jgi:hypothetical protein